MEQVARILGHRVKKLFPDGAVVRADLRRDVEYPSQLTARALRHVTDLDDLPPPIADEARDAPGSLTN